MGALQESLTVASSVICFPFVLGTKTLKM